MTKAAAVAVLLRLRLCLPAFFRSGSDLLCNKMGNKICLSFGNLLKKKNEQISLLINQSILIKGHVIKDTKVTIRSG